VKGGDHPKRPVGTGSSSGAKGEETGGGAALSRVGKSIRKAALRGEGFRGLVAKWLGITGALKVGRELPDECYGHVTARTLSSADATFIPSTNSRAIDMVEWLEAECRVPALSGVLPNYMAQTMGCREPIHGFQTRPWEFERRR
jgi:hypothetical protein